MRSNHSELIYVHCCWCAMLRAMKFLPVMIIVLITFSGPLEYSFSVILKTEFYLSRCCGGGGMVSVAQFITSH